MRRGSALYAGEVYHRRIRPRRHVLRYRVFSLLVDLAEIDDLARRIPFFSHDRFNLVALHDADFGDGIERSDPRGRIIAWVSLELGAAGLDAKPARVLLSCYPRVLGYAFNPLSLYYCLDGEERVYAIVHEVRNTFGERRAYVLGATEEAGWIRQRVDKGLFVSPFAPMDLQYRFRLNEPGERQVVVIRASDRLGLLITASYVAERRPLTSATLARQLLAMPFLTFKVVAGIHYEALKLWLKRVPLFRHVPLREIPAERRSGLAQCASGEDSDSHTTRTP